MGRLVRRLERLESRRSQVAKSWSSPEVYDWIRQEAEQDIEEDRAAGREPIYCITDSGEVQTEDGRTIRDFGDFIRALDESIARTEEEIAELESEE